MTLESINCTSDLTRHKKTFYSQTTVQLLLSLKLEKLGGGILNVMA